MFLQASDVRLHWCNEKCFLPRSTSSLSECTFPMYKFSVHMAKFPMCTCTLELLLEEPDRNVWLSM